MVSDHEVRREARRIFKKLLEPGAFLRDLTGYLASSGKWGVFTARNGFGKPVAKLEPEFVEAFRRNDWLQNKADRELVLSPVGTAWYRRVSAETEPFASQHRDTAVRRVDPEGGRQTATVNNAESPLAWLRARSNATGESLLSKEQFEAGERLRRDFEQAQLRQHVTANWDMRVTASGRSGGARPGQSISDRALAARQRYHGALEAVGPELASVLVEVCCNLCGLSDAEHTMGWPKRSGKVVLQIALNSLARHYAASSSRRSERSEVRHWGAQDYRPAISVAGGVGSSD